MKHILFLISNDCMTRGGAEEVMRLTVMHFLRQGDDVHVFFLLEKRFGDWEKVHSSNLHLYYSAGGGKLGVFSIVKNFWSVRHIRFDYSFSSIIECNGFVSIMKRIGVLRIKKVIVRESTMVFNRYKGGKLMLYKILYRLGYPAVHTVICQTEWMREVMLKNLPWLDKKTRVIVVPNPVDLQMIREKEVEQVATDCYAPYILACGRLNPVKAYDLLVRAFASLKQRYSNLKLVILGEGGERKNLECLSKELGYENDVFLPGQVANVYPYMRNAKLCVVSSHIEGFPNVLLQMMSQNERVVSTTCAGGIDKIKGLITCKPSDLSALEEAIERGLETDVKDARKLFDEELNSRSIEKFVHVITE